MSKIIFILQKSAWNLISPNLKNPQITTHHRAFLYIHPKDNNVSICTCLRNIFILDRYEATSAVVIRSQADATPLAQLQLYTLAQRIISVFLCIYPSFFLHLSKSWMLVAWDYYITLKVSNSYYIHIKTILDFFLHRSWADSVFNSLNIFIIYKYSQILLHPKCWHLSTLTTTHNLSTDFYVFYPLYDVTTYYYSLTPRVSMPDWRMVYFEVAVIWTWLLHSLFLQYYILTQ